MGSFQFNLERKLAGDLTVSGDLTVEGDTTTVSSTNTVITDKRIELGNGTTGTPAADAGIIIERGDQDNAIFAWDESADSFVVGTTAATGATTGNNLTITPTALNTGDITVGSGAEADTKIVFDGNAQDYRIGIDDGTDTLEIGHGSAHGARIGLAISSAGEITQLGNSNASPTNGHFLKWDGSKVLFASVSSGGGADTGLANTFTEAQTVSKDQDSELVALILKNESDSNNTDGLVSLRFDLEDTGGNAVDSGKIAVKKNEAFTATVGTQDSNMVFSTSLNGALTERMTLDSDGVLTCDAGVTAGSTVITDDSIVMTPSSGDTATIAAGSDGTLTITTVDAGGTAANVGFVVDGAFDIDAAGAVTIDGSAITIGGDSDVAIDIDSSTLDIDASGLLTIDSVGLSVDSTGVAANITSTTDGAAEDFTISLAGATDSSLILSSTGTAADALQISTSAGGMDITVAGAAAGEDLDITANSSVNITSSENVADAIVINASAGGIDILASGAAAGEDIDIIATGSSVNVTSTENAANAIYLRANGGTSETINIHSDQGTGEGESASIVIQSDDGGISLVTNSAKDLTLTGGQAIITAEHDVASAIKLHADAGSSQTILVVNDEGTSEAAIALTSTAGGIDLNAAAGKDITMDAGQILVTSAHNVANAIYLRANAGTSEAIKIHADQGTGAGSIELTSDAGSIDINAGDNITVDAADEISIATTSADGHITLTSAHTAGVAFHIDANANAASEVQIDAGILDIDVTGAATLDATSMTTTAATQSIVASTSLTVTTPTTIITSTTSTKPTLELRNTTDTNGTAGPALTFSKFPGDNAGEADNQTLGSLLFRGIDSQHPTGNDTIYGQMTCHSSDKTDGTEGGEFRFFAQVGGTLSQILNIGGQNNSQPCEVTVNESSVDCDFRVESGDKTHMLFVDAGLNRVSIGDSTNDPAAILEIEGASDSAVPVLKVITADVDQVGVEFALANTTAIGIDIAGSNTTTEVMKINADGLTSGDAMTINSNSSDNTARSLLKLHNNHASATGTSVIEVVQDSTGPILDATYGANGAGVALKMKEVAIDISASSTTTSTASNFFPALAVPIAMQILVTSNIENAKHITKLGTGSNDGLFANTGGSALGDGVLDEINDNLTLALNAGSEAFGNGAAGIGAAQNLVITHGDNPNAGAVRATLWYYQLAVDTSG